MKEIYLKSKDYIEGWLKGAGWILSPCPFSAIKINNELTHYVHPNKIFTYNIAIFKWIGEDISKFIKKDVSGNYIHNLLGLAIHPDWLIINE